MNESISKWYDVHSKEVIALSQEMFDNPESALEEYFACKRTAAFMRTQGFEVKEVDAENKGGKENCVIATYGSGKPVIGILGEFDALNGLGQEAVPYKAPLKGPGHGCGHNLMGAGCAGATAALKAAVEAENLTGTIIYFGCPAEETLTGKALMVRDGYFKDVDLCFNWHPGPSGLGFMENILQANTNMLFSFHGTSSHAALMPEMGRSALDAAELMNTGVQYLREHVTDDVRIHYSYTAAGEKPNIVPDYAQTNYFIRASSRVVDDEVVERVKDVARGAALMTGTKVEWQLLSQVYETFANDEINNFAYESAKKIPPIEWDESDFEFAKTLYKNANGKEPTFPLLGTSVIKPTGVHGQAFGSSDVGDVSHVVPTCQIGGQGLINGIPMHHWSVVSCAGSVLGHKGEIYAGKVVAQCAYDALKSPESIEKIWKEFREKRKDMAPYKPIEL